MKTNPKDFNLFPETVLAEYNNGVENFIIAALQEHNIPVDKEDGYCVYLNCNQLKTRVVDAIKNNKEIEEFIVINSRFLDIILKED